MREDIKMCNKSCDKCTLPCSPCHKCQNIRNEQRHMEVFSIVAQCRKRFAQKFASTKFHQKTAKICESYTKRFPILFPECSITRKQHVLSIVAPKQIRQQQIVYKIWKLVERGENLHCKLNKLVITRAKVAQYFGFAK